jgi:hypothetical protein
MKRSLVFIALMLSFSGFTQSFTLNELIKLANSSDDYFDTYVTQKGYVFQKTKDDKYVSSDQYMFLVNGFRTHFIFKAHPKNETFGWVIFQTPKSSTYLQIKNELKSKGYVFVEKGNAMEATFLKFKKGTNEVEIFSGSDANQYTGKSSVDYQISVKTNFYGY